MRQVACCCHSNESSAIFSFVSKKFLINAIKTYINYVVSFLTI